MTHEHETLLRDRAYRLWEDDGRPEGKLESHWHQAMKELGLAQPVEQVAGTTVDPVSGKKKRAAGPKIKP